MRDEMREELRKAGYVARLSGLTQQLARIGPSAGLGQNGAGLYHSLVQ